jgi:hypothetical protein
VGRDRARADAQRHGAARPALPRPASDDVSAIARLKEPHPARQARFACRPSSMRWARIHGRPVWVRHEETAVRFDLNRTVKEEFERRAAPSGGGAAPIASRHG